MMDLRPLYNSGWSLGNEHGRRDKRANRIDVDAAFQKEVSRAHSWSKVWETGYREGYYAGSTTY